MAFTAGTLLSGTVVFAASNVVQAQKVSTTVQYNGTTLAKPPGLVYGGSMYVQLYSIEQALKKAGLTPGWNGSVLSLADNDVAKLSDGTSDNTLSWIDIGYSVARVITDILDFEKAASASDVSEQSMTNIDNRIIASLEANIAALQKDTPTDSSLVSLQKEYINSLNELVTAFGDFTTAVHSKSDTDLQKFETDFNQADSDFMKAMDDYGAYTPQTTDQSSANTMRASGRQSMAHFARSLFR